MDVVVAETRDTFAGACADRIAQACARAVASRGRFAIALAGGSTPVPVHRALARPPYRERIDWAKVDILFGDERAVPPDSPESNYAAAREALIRHVPIPAANVHRMEADSPDLVGAARRYEARLEAVCGGRPDLICIGIGFDGHIFSLFPGAPAIGETHALVVAELDPPMDPPLSRLTFTPPMIERATEVLAIAAGSSKRDAVRAAIEAPSAPGRVPAHLLRRARGLVWVLDRDAAGAGAFEPHVA